MTFAIIQRIKKQLIQTFAIIDEWFDKEVLYYYKDSFNGLTVKQHLEFITLMNEHLMNFMNDEQNEYTLNQAEETLFDKILHVHPWAFGAFEPLLPVIMNGKVDKETYLRLKDTTTLSATSLVDTRRNLRDQLHRCLCLLDLTEHKEGLMYKTAFGVNEFVSLDVYQSIHFMIIHMQKQGQQLTEIEDAFHREQSVVG